MSESQSTTVGYACSQLCFILHILTCQGNGHYHSIFVALAVLIKSAMVSKYLLLSC